MMPEPELTTDILSYFVRNPHAADNLDGVACWRLLEETIHRKVEATSQALEWLVSQGFLREVPTVGSGPLYRLNVEKRGDAKAFLERTRIHRSVPSRR
jgi:hypothetical protein